MYIFKDINCSNSQKLQRVLTNGCKSYMMISSQATYDDVQLEAYGKHLTNVTRGFLLVKKESGL